MLKPVIVPSKGQIDGWNDLNEIPIIETVSRAVPTSVILRNPSEDDYDRIQSIKAGTSSSKEVTIIHELERRSAIIESYLIDYYSRRSISFPLLRFSESLKKGKSSESFSDPFRSQEASGIIKGILAPLLDGFRSHKNDCIEISKFFAILFSDESIWNKGNHSDTFLDRVCLLFHKLIALENIIPYKRGLVDDISLYMNLLNDQSFAADILSLRVWIVNPKSITDLILKNSSELSCPLVNKIFSIIIDHIQKCLTHELFVSSEMRYAYVSTMVFMCNFYEFFYNKEKKSIPESKVSKMTIKPPSNVIRAFVCSVIKVHKTLHLMFEIAPNLEQFVPKIFLVQKNEKLGVELPHIITYSLEELLEIAQNDYRELTQMVFSITNENPDLELSKRLCEHLIVTFRNSGRISSMISEALETLRLTIPPIKPNPPPENPYLFQYEWAMQNIPDTTKRLFLMLLLQSRSTREFIVNNMNAIIRSIHLYTQHTIQFYFQCHFLKIIYKHKDHKNLFDQLNKLRTMLGFFKSSDELIITDQHVKNRKKRKIVFPESPPNIALLELSRVQIQSLIDADSPTSHLAGFFKGGTLSKHEEGYLNEFVQQTKFFDLLLRFNDTLDEAFDQSKLYYKEHWLDMCHTNFFKVTTSLPVVLSAYSLEHFNDHNLTDAMFYPISIYDDAASKALRYLKSRLIYEEIKEEARICLISITRMISDSAFSPVRRFMTLRSIGKDLFTDISNFSPSSQIMENYSITRLGSVFKQNQVFVLGCQIDTKGLISERINQLLHEAAQQIFNLSSKFGMYSMIAISKLLQILKGVHELFIEYDLPLLPFSDMIRNVQNSDTPDSFSSILLINMSNHLVSSVITDSIVYHNPIRIVPKHKVSFENEPLFTGNPGELLKIIFDPTSAFLSIESFRELFFLIDDGAITMLHGQLIMELEDTFHQFSSLYRIYKDQILRINDSQLSANSSQVIDRFTGAYASFLNNSEINHMFTLLSEIATIMTLSEMIDQALIMKRSSRDIINLYISGRHVNSLNQDQNNAHIPELFELFDNMFRYSTKYVDAIESFPSEKEIQSSYLLRCITILYQLYVQNQDLFFEFSPTLTNYQSYTGFASRWSVFEFLFCMTEVLEGENCIKNRTFTTQNTISRFGDGIHHTVALLLCFSNQNHLYRMLSIGEKIESHAKSEFSAKCSERVKRYLSVHRLVRVSLNCSISTLIPYVKHIQKTVK